VLILLGNFGTVWEELAAAASCALKMEEAAGSSKMLLQIC